MNDYQNNTVLSRVGNFIVDRLSERSTRLAIVAIAGMFGVAVQPQMLEQIALVLGTLTGVIEAFVPDDMRKRVIIGREAKELKSQLNAKAMDYLPQSADSEEIKDARRRVSSVISKHLATLQGCRFEDLQDVRTIGAYARNSVRIAEEGFKDRLAALQGEIVRRDESES